MSIRPLTSELQRVAEEELNEVPDRIQEDLNQIREWLSKQSHIKARTDDQWLIAFLRASKFSLARTKEKIDKYYTARTILPELTFNRDPFLPEIQAILSQGLVLILPKTVTPAGPRIALCRFDRINSKDTSVLTAVKALGMIIDILLLEDDNYTVAGGCGIVNAKNAPYKFIVQLSPDLVRNVIVSGQDAYTTRIKGLFILNTPSIIMTVYHTFKMLISEKNRSRVSFYDEHNLEDFHKIIPRSVLPKEYGGDGGSCDEIAAYWKKKVESYRDWFLEDTRYGTDETKRLGKPPNTSLEGSFRKLDLD